MKMEQDGVRVFTLPDEATCLRDEERRSPLELEECPVGEEICRGDCFFYAEDNE